MVSRKRGRAEMESPTPAQGPGLLDQIRNMWEFANLMQYIFIFGKAVKIHEDIDIEVHLLFDNASWHCGPLSTSYTQLISEMSAGA